VIRPPLKVSIGGITLSSRPAGLVRQKVAAIFTLGGDAAPLAAKAATSTIPCDGDHSKFDSLFGAVLSMNCWRAEFDE
jgi:hypothetical protein